MRGSHRSFLLRAAVLACLAACAEGQSSEPAPADGALDAPVVIDGSSSEVDAAVADAIVDAAVAGDASVTSACSLQQPCGSGQCCHFGFCVAGTQIILVCLPDDALACDEVTPCGADHCCWANVCIPGADFGGVCVPRTM
jgi:hypothetical protein